MPLPISTRRDGKDLPVNPDSDLAGRQPRAGTETSRYPLFRTPGQIAVQVLALLFMAAQAWLFQHHLADPHSLVPTDFNDYHVVGRMVLAGKWAQAYDWPALKAAQVAQLGTWAFMPWAYPPPFTLFTGVLGLLPIAAAYLVFTGASWLLFYTALHRLAGRATIPALVITLPALIINAKCGQNGFLSAGLIGWTLVALRDRSPAAGWPLGLMIFKPHLALGVGLLALLERHWGAILRAGLLALALCLTATVVCGPAIWTAFREGTATASAAMWSGDFPLERMTSVFAALHRFGLPPAIAMTVHLLVVLAGALLLWRCVSQGRPRELLLAAAICLSLIVSPYSYDYDMVGLALAFGLILPRFLARARLSDVALLLGLSWIALSNYLFIGLRQIWYGVPKIDASMHLWTISPITLAALAVLIVIVLRRPQAPPRSDALAQFYSALGGESPT